MQKPEFLTYSIVTNTYRNCGHATWFDLNQNLHSLYSVVEIQKRQHHPITSCHKNLLAPLRVCQPCSLRSLFRWCRYDQPPATGSDSSSIINNRNNPPPALFFGLRGSHLSEFVAAGPRFECGGRPFLPLRASINRCGRWPHRNYGASVIHGIAGHVRCLIRVLNMITRSTSVMDIFEVS